MKSRRAPYSGFGREDVLFLKAGDLLTQALDNPAQGVDVGVLAELSSTV